MLVKEPRNNGTCSWDIKPGKVKPYFLYNAQPVPANPGSDFTVKPFLSGHFKRRQKLVFKNDYRLMQVKSIAECSKGSILQYFRPPLSYHLPLRPLLCLSLSDRLRQGLLYNKLQISTSFIVCTFHSVEL